MLEPQTMRVAPCTAEKTMGAKEEQKQLTAIAATVTSKIWCSYHQGFSNAATGRMIERHKRQRFMCSRCLAKRKLPPMVPVEPPAGAKDNQ